MRKIKTGWRPAQLLIPILVVMVLCGAPLRGAAAVDPACNVTITPDLVLHIPVIGYLDKLYSLDLKYVGNSGTSGDLLGFTIAGAKETTQDCAAQSVLFQAEQLTLNIASLVSGSDNYDASLELVSTRQISAGTAAAAAAGNLVENRVAAAAIPVFDFRVRNLTKNSDMWKGSARCHKTTITPDAFIGTITVSDWAIGVATFGRFDWSPVGEYELLNGMVTYRWSETMNGTPNSWSISTVDTITIPMKNNSLSGNPAILNISDADPRYYWGYGYEQMPALSANVIACCGVNGETYSYTTPVTTGSVAEWLKISPAKFTRSDADTLSGKESTSVNFGGIPITWDCSWFFLYYP